MWIATITRKVLSEIKKREIRAETLNDIVEVMDEAGYLMEDGDTLEIHIFKEEK